MKKNYFVTAIYYYVFRKSIYNSIRAHLAFLLTFTCPFAFSQSLPPFDCSTGLGYILTNPTTNANGNVTSLYSFNLSNGASTLIKAGILPEPDRFLNAFGYNVVDNYLYGYRYNTNQIARLGSNGAVELLTVSGLSAGGAYATGDVSAAGILYLYGSSSVVAIDLNPASANYLVAQTRLSGTAASALSGLNDWAISPIDGKIYGVTTAKTLVRYDPVANTVTTIGAVTGLASQSGAFGTAFMDSYGNMYIGNNSSGNIYKIPTPHSPASPIVATLFSTSLAGKFPGDGARCPNQAILPSANNDQACGLSNTTPISISVVANDGAGSFPLNSASVRLVDPVSGSAVTSVTVAGQGTYTVNTSTGVVTFTPLSGFTQSSVKYIIRDTQGGQSGQATISVILCALPVTLSNFTARADQNVIHLSWKTSAETNFDHFELERTTDPRDRFDYLATIAPRADAKGGTYTYQDAAIQPEIYYYYRLKLVDLDGSVAYSAIVSARQKTENNLQVFPNPAQTTLTFTSLEPIVSYQLLSSSGKTVVAQSMLASKQIDVSLTGLPAGIYVLQTTTKSGVVESRKVVIE
jgi:CshA-type fibril repeat protein